MQPEIIFWAVWAVAIVLTWPVMLGFTIKSRRTRGEPIFPKPPPNALFAESAASGKVRGSWSGGSQCLLVAVTSNELWIALTFPFSLFVPYGAFGLEHRAPRRAVKAERHQKLLNYYNIEVTFDGPRGPMTVALRLREPDRFLAALGH